MTSSRRSLLPRALWVAFGCLVLVSYVTGLVAGFRADELAGAPPAPAGLDLAALSTITWLTVGLTVVVGIMALVMTVSRRNAGSAPRI